MKRALPSDTLFQPRLRQRNKSGSEILYIFEVLFERHMKLYLSYILSFTRYYKNMVYYIYNSYVTLQIQIVKIYVIKKILTK